MKKFLFNYVLPYLIYGLLFIWYRTIRVHHLSPEQEKSIHNHSGRYILTLWHGRIFYLFYHLRGHRDYHLLISPSADGDLLARLARLMGYSVIRGSSFKQPVAAARSLIKVLRRNERIILIADGSRGPRCKAQPGSLQIAGITGAPVFPMTFGAKRSYVFNSWDRFVLPLPFTRCTVHFGAPIHIASRHDENVLRERVQELEGALNLLTQESETSG
jgi:lysophospholipid acyltransferase (LPLAT)-like uncharacterized protein